MGAAEMASENVASFEQDEKNAAHEPKQVLEETAASLEMKQEEDKKDHEQEQQIPAETAAAEEEEPPAAAVAVAVASPEMKLEDHDQNHGDEEDEEEAEEEEEEEEVAAMVEVEEEYQLLLQPKGLPETGDAVKNSKMETGNVAVEKTKSSEEAAAQRMKTSLCSYFRKKGCRHGENCRYAHGESELQPRPDGTWDPTSERAKSFLATQKQQEQQDAAGAGGVKVTMGSQPSSTTTTLLQKCIVHVPRGWSQDKLKSFLSDHSVPFATAKKRKAMSVCFVSFETAEQVATSAKILDGLTVQNKRLKFADVLPRAWEQKATGMSGMALDDDDDGNNDDEKTEHHKDAVLYNDDDDNSSKQAESAGDEKPVLEPYRDVCQVVTPLAHLSYADQLNVKKDDITQVLKRLARSIRKGCPAGLLLPDWLVAARDREGLPCEFEGVIASPMIDGYRNKCEFSIGSGPDGKRVVGFQLGTFREGVNAVAEPGSCRNVSLTARMFVAAFQSFIRTSKLPVWNKQDNTGFWRMLTIREGRKPVNKGEASTEMQHEIAEVMLVVQVCPTGVPEERRAKEYTQMSLALTNAAASLSLPLTALLVQDHVGVSNAAPVDSPLHALPIHANSAPEELEDKLDDTTMTHIHDYIGGLCFRISPTAFFQVNSVGAERLYTMAGDWAGLGPDTLLFDVCCGTGTIGLTLAHRVGMVVGIEMNASAVADAQINASLNGISNCKFVCGKAEDVINNLLKEYVVGDLEDSVKEAESSTNTTTRATTQADAEETVVRSELPDLSVKETENGTHQTGKGTSKVGISSGQPIKQAEEESHTTGEKRLHFSNVVAIVDPPRVGLHHIVLRTLRLHKQLRRLVYISCNPESLLANAVELCMPLEEGTAAAEKSRSRGQFKGTTNLGHARRRVKTLPASEPFRPVKAAAVDMFPHTKHCEMIMLFER